MIRKCPPKQLFPGISYTGTRCTHQDRRTRHSPSGFRSLGLGNRSLHPEVDKGTKLLNFFITLNLADGVRYGPFHTFQVMMKFKGRWKISWEEKGKLESRSGIRIIQKRYFYGLLTTTVPKVLFLMEECTEQLSLNH